MEKVEYNSCIGCIFEGYNEDCRMDKGHLKVMLDMGLSPCETFLGQYIYKVKQNEI